MSGEKSLLRRLATLPPREIARKALARSLRAVLLRLEARRARKFPQVMPDSELLGALELPFESMTALLGHLRTREKPTPFVHIDSVFLESLGRLFPSTVRKTLNDADQICQHRFTQLGVESISLGTQIDWHRDYKSGHRWPPDAHHRLIRETPRGGGADVLFPWWLSSFYHLIPLGKAFRYSHAGLDGSAAAPECYAREFCDQVQNWVAQNPYPFGINWRSTTIVALRLIHWIWAWHLFGISRIIPDRFWFDVLKQILRHARHIRKNLEWFPIRTNHYLTNLAALLYAGLFLPEFREGAEWVAFAHAELVQEIEHHSYPDGVVHEGSLNYHRFVTEIFLATTILGQKHGLAFSDPFLDRLEKMVEFLLYALWPDGTLPRVGDAADIRLQNLDNRDVIADPCHLLALGGILFQRGDFKKAAGSFPEYTFWLLGEEGAGQYRELVLSDAPLASKSFPEGGFHIIRDEDVYVLIRCGPLGLRGIKGHGHYDQLGIELFAGGELILADPGWYAYEADPEMFCQLKATRAHNTVVVDDRDQVADDLFLYPPPSRPVPRLLHWKSGADETVFCGEHALYANLPDPVIHRREVRYRAGECALWIEDLLDGREVHQLEWNFHFAPGVAVKYETSVAIWQGSRIWGRLECEGLEDGQVTVDEDWVAPRYGVRLRALVLRLRWMGQLPRRVRVLISWRGRAR
jgi:hypothetical protein